MSAATIWLVDGNNVFGSRPDGWWNDRPAAMERFTNAVARWCWTHADKVVVVFDQPVPARVSDLEGGNLEVLPAERKGRNAADDTIVKLADVDSHDANVIVVTSDKGLRSRLGTHVDIIGSGRFRDMVGY